MSGFDINAILRYEPETGRILWMPRGAEFRSWNGLHAGKEAGCVNRRGYKQIGIDGRTYQAHRIAWLLHHGRWPQGLIDHINGDPLDNRIKNLREATHRENCANATVKKSSHSGLKGVGFNHDVGRWYARIRVAGGRKHLGLFDTAEAAHKAYAAAAADIHGQFARSF